MGAVACPRAASIAARLLHSGIQGAGAVPYEAYDAGATAEGRSARARLVVVGMRRGMPCMGRHRTAATSEVEKIEIGFLRRYVQTAVLYDVS